MRKLNLTRIFIIILGVVILILAIKKIDVRMDEPLIFPVDYSDIVEDVSQKTGIDDYVLYSVIYCESSFNEKALSKSGAMGLMQIIPDTAKMVCTWGNNDLEYDESRMYEPEYNIYIGALYLDFLYKQFNNWDLVHASYHAGHNRVKAWMKDGTISFDENGDPFGIPIDATEKYVEKIRKVKAKYKTQLYGDTEEK